MYLNGRQHILSGTLSAAAIINLLLTCAAFIAEKVLPADTPGTPNMLNSAYWNMQILLSVAQIVLTAIFFAIAFRKVRHSLRVIEKDDYYEMARLQEEYLEGRRSILSAEIILQLLEMWAVILVGVDIVYSITSQLYRNFIARLMLSMDMNEMNEVDAFVSLYNSTHGFKYIGMLIAIVLGVLVTGIFLHDKFLALLAGVLVSAFLIAFAAIGIQTISVGSRSYAIVWTSVIFHLLDTAGLFLIAFYIHRRYTGI